MSVEEATAAHPSDTVVQRRLEREALDWLEAELGDVTLYATRVVSGSGHSVEFDGMCERAKVAVEVFVGEKVGSAQKNKVAADVLKLGVVAREVLGADARLIVLTPSRVQRALARHWVSEVAADSGVELVGFPLGELPSHRLLWAARMRQGHRSRTRLGLGDSARAASRAASQDPNRRQMAVRAGRPFAVAQSW